MNEKNQKDTDNRKDRKKRRFLRVKIVVFFAALFSFAVIGLILPLRPTESALENRTLEKFPTFTMASFLDGDYFSDVSTWYSDTYPFREELLAANAGFENLYGIKGEQIIYSDTQVAENTTDEGTLDDILTEDESPPDQYDIPVEEDEEEIPVTEEIPSVPEPVEGTETEEEPAAAEETEAAEEAEAAEEEEYVDAAIDVEPEAVGTVYVTGDTAFELFYFNEKAENQYIDILNKAEARLGSLANVYAILVPNSCGINLTEKVQKKIGAGDQDYAISYIYDSVDSAIKTVPTFDILRQHNSEYLYFRTDHHWTALGSYYVYTSFCEVKGVEPTPLEDFETVEFPGFLGTLYSGSNQASSLKNNPDTIIAYIPPATNNVTLWNTVNGEFNWNIIFDVSDYQPSQKYSCFIGGDQGFAEIDNPEINDGSSCVLIKDSFGNAFVPFLVAHYDHIYVADYRYFADYPVYGNSIYNLVVDKNIQDVIILINTQTVVESQVALISALFD